MVETKITPWFHIEELVEFLEQGDLIEIKRDLYMHWAVFQGRSDDVNYVIHLSAPDGKEKASSNIFGSSSGYFSSDCAVVQRNDIKLVAGTSLCRVNNSKDLDYEPYQPAEVIFRAMNEFNKCKYNLLLTNCEHFATWCRYGTKISTQSTTAKSLVLGAVAAAAAGSGLVGLTVGVACFAACKKASKTWNRTVRRYHPYTPF